MKTHSLFVLPVLILGVLECRVSCASLDQWVWRNPTPQGHSLYDVAYGNGVFVAIGQAGTILTSSDKGTNWTVRAAGTNTSLFLRAITFANNRFIAVGSDGVLSNPTIWNSSDGINWDSLIVPTNFVTLSGVAYGNGVYVASSSTRTLISSNALDWTVLTNATGNDIAFGNGIFAAVGMQTFFSGKIQTSTNGLDWDLRRNDITAQLTGVTYGQSGFVAVGTGHSVVSTDGINWTDNNVNLQPVEVTHGDGWYVATGASLWGSPNGSNWFLLELDCCTAGYGDGAAFGEGAFVSVGGNGELWDSVGGTNWTRRTTSIPVIYGTPSPLEDIAYGNGMFVAVGRTLNAGSAAGAYLSTNAVNWSHTLPGAHLRAVAFGNERFVAVGKETDGFGNMKAFTLSDGPAFVISDLGVSGILQDVLYDGSQFLAVGDSGKIFTSPNGTNWMAQTSGTPLAIPAVAYGDGRYVALLQSSPNVLVSTNSIDWSSSPFGFSAFVSSIAFGNGVFVCVGGSQVLTSTDGISWNSGPVPDGENLRRVEFYDGQFIALSGATTLSAGNGAVIQTSPDGANWTRHNSDTSSSLNGIVFDGSSYVVVGNDLGGRGPVIRQSVTSPVATITLTNPRFLPSGSFAFDVAAPLSTQVEIHATTNFQSWELLDSISMETSPMEFADPATAGVPNRYYEGRTSE